MNEDRQPGLLLLAAGLLFGVLGDCVLRSLPWGLGATFLVMALVGVLVALQLRYDTPAGSGRVLYSGIALALSLGFAWRDAAVLKLLDVLALVMTLGLLGAERKGLEGGRSLGGIGLRVCGTAVYTWLSPPLLVVHDVDWSRLDTGICFGCVRGGPRHRGRPSRSARVHGAPGDG